MDDFAVLLQSLDGKWEQCGIDRLRGIVPEGIQATANEAGSDTIRFTLRRDPGAIYPDLTAYTPCDYFEAGEKVWSGRVWETPTKDGPDASISVEGRGWQFHLDDDAFERAWVHTRLPDYRDTRSFLGASLTDFPTIPTVQAGDGGIVLGWADGTTTVINTQVGVTLDLGPYSTGKRIVIDYAFSAGITSGWTLYATGHDGENYSTSNPENAITVTGSASGSGTGTGGTLSTARRYLTLRLVRFGATGVCAGDATAKISVARVFRDTAYESGGVSTLKSSTLVTDAIDAGTILLSSDRTGIEASSFSWPEFALDGLKSPREVCAAANATEDRILQVDVERRPIFKAKPTYPIFEVGNWSGSEFEDASANSGEEIYNRVVVEGTGPDGAPLRVERRNPTSLTEIDQIDTPAPDNPSFATDTSGWSASSGTLSRTTTAGEYDSAPAGGKWATPSLGQTEPLTATFTGTFQAGRTYLLSFRIKANGTILIGGGFGVLGVDTGALFNSNYSPFYFQATTSFQTMQYVWTPTASRTTATLRITVASTSGTYYVDSLVLYRTVSTLVDRRGFQRTKILPVRSALTTDLANQIGDTFLLGHKTTPLKGSLSAQRLGVRRVLGGAPVHPAHLLKNTQQMLRLSHRIDPDTGGQGRDGRIAAVSWDRDKGEASVAIDNERTNFEAMLERLAVVVGGA